MPSGSTTDFARFMVEVAAGFFGEPNRHLSSKDELRFGKKGSLSIDVKKGTFYDHEQKVGGGVLDLVQKETGLANGEAVEWLKEHGYPIEDDRRAPAQEARKPAVQRPNKVVASWDYVDEQGDLVFQVQRLENEAGDKAYRQRRKPRPDDDPGKIRDGGWIYNVKGVRLVLYRLPEVIEALSLGKTIYIAEGEKKADILWENGFPATCNPMGSGKWPGPHMTEILRGADVVYLPDNDDAGRRQRDLVCAELKPVAATVRFLELPGLGPKGDVWDWFKAGGGPAELNELVESRSVTWEPDRVGLHFGAVWFTDLDKQVEGPRWLIDDLVTKSDASLVFGASQSGKSFFAASLAMAVARGEPVFDRKASRGGVVYIAGEGKAGYRNRIRAYRDYHQLSVQKLPFVLVPAAVDLFSRVGDVDTMAGDINVIAAQMKSEFGVNLDLIVVDTFWASSQGADENSAKDIGQIIKNGAKLQEITKAHMMWVHHKNAGGERPRGNTALFASVDNAIEINCDEAKNRSARIVKQKDAEDGIQIAFRLQVVQIGSRDDGKPITSCVVVPAQEFSADPAKRDGPAMSPANRIALSCLADALNDHGQPPPQGMGIPVGVRTVVHVDYWKRIYRSKGFAEELTDPAFRQAFKRAGEALLARKFIGRAQPFVWLVREPR